MSSVAWWIGLREPPEPAPRATFPAEFVAAQTELHANWRVYRNSNSKMHESGYAERPLPKGSQVPPLEATGWLNDAPPDAEKLSEKVIVIDVWDGLCVHCALSRPVLLRVNEKFRDRGVVFVGVTSADRDDARGYVDDGRLAWPNGYGAGKTIDALEANAPTLFVVGADGRVWWNDDRARYRNQNVARIQEVLESAIEEALRARSSPANE
jgi:thiol-disulfide isomerase/thioredoxin